VAEIKTSSLTGAQPQDFLLVVVVVTKALGPTVQVKLQII